MKTGVKIGLGVVAVLGLAVVAGPSLVDWNEFKPKITEVVEAKTGRSLAINGDISLSLIPSPRLEVSQIQLSNVAGAKHENMVQVEEMDVHVAFWPLLKKQIVVKSLTLQEPVIWLEKTASGAASWELKPASAEAETADGKPAPAVSFDTIEIEGANINYMDHAQGEPISLKNIDAEITADSLSGPFEIALTAEYKQNPVQAKINVGTGEGSIPLQATATLTNGQASFDGTVATGGDLKITGDVTAQSEKIQALLKDFGVEAPEKLSGAAAVTGQLAWQGGQLSLNPMRVKMMGYDYPGALQLKGDVVQLVFKEMPGSTQVTASGSLGQEGSAKTLHVEAKSGELSKFLSAFGLSALPAGTLQNFQLATDITMTDTSTQLANLTTRFDDSQINGAVTLEKGKTGALSANLRGTRLNVDKYKSSGSDQAAAKKKGLGLPAFLTDRRSDLTFAFDQLLAGGQDMKNVQGKVVIANDILQVESLSVGDVKGFKAAVDGKITDIDDTGAVAVNYQLQPNNRPGQITGEATGSLKDLDLTLNMQAPEAGLAGQGTAKVDLTGTKPALKANLRFETLDLGRLKNLTGSQGATPAASSSSNKNSFEALKSFDGGLELEIGQLNSETLIVQNLKTQLDIANGVAKIEDLRGDTLNGSFTASGQLDANPATPTLNLVADSQDLNIAQYFQQRGKDAPITGTLRQNMEVTSQGKNGEELLANLNGGGEFLMTDGQINGIDFPEISKRLGNIDDTGDIFSVFTHGIGRQGSTTYESLEGKYQIQNGIMQLTSSQLQGDKVEANATGQINLRNKTLNIRTNATLPEHANSPPLGVIINGALSAPQYSLDTAQVQQHYVNKGISKLFDKLTGDDKNDAAAPETSAPAEQDGGADEEFVPLNGGSQESQGLESTGAEQPAEAPATESQQKSTTPAPEPTPEPAPVTEEPSSTPTQEPAPEPASSEPEPAVETAPEPAPVTEPEPAPEFVPTQPEPAPAPAAEEAPAETGNASEEFQPLSTGE